MTIDSATIIDVLAMLVGIPLVGGALWLTGETMWERRKERIAAEQRVASAQARLDRLLPRPFDDGPFMPKTAWFPLDVRKTMGLDVDDTRPDVKVLPS